MEPSRHTRDDHGTLAGNTLKTPVSDNQAPVAAVARRVLLIAYHFPPDAASTGRLRTLGFMRHLPAFGWQPAVLTAHPRAYEQVDESGIADIHGAHPVRRAFALDTRRHLGWRGKYLSLLATPDRWVTWWPDAVRVGLHMIRTHRIDAIWSTFPIMTSHMIGLSLSRMTGLPWVADFRDPVVSNGTGFNQRVCNSLERRVVHRAACSVFTTPGARSVYADRFRHSVDKTRFRVIPNGYEEDIFQGIVRPEPQPGNPCTLVHGGVLYHEGRNPLPFFQALVRLKQNGVADSSSLRIVLRASGHEEVYGAELKRLGLTNMVQLAPSISYRAALQEQAAADGLLLFQGSEFNAQIPAKVYEYLRLRVPIIALTDSAGDTATLLRDIGGATCIPMDDSAAIASALGNFMAGWRNKNLVAPGADAVAGYSRFASTKRLAGLLDEVVTHK